MIRLRLFLFLALLFGLWSCSPSDQATPTPSAIPSMTPSPSASPTASSVPPTPTATPLTCLTQPGRVDNGEIDTTKPPQLFLIYLPPCYDANTDQHYPVLYLLHGQTYIDDQWVRLGAPQAADHLIRSGQAPPFIMVFPDDRYWNLLDVEDGFGDRVVNVIIPYIDSNYRTLSDRQHRAVGGLSLGGGWAADLGLTHYDLFGSVGLHSPAIRDEDSPYVEDWIKAVPSASWPRIWIDAGDRDRDLGLIRQFESLLSEYQVPHEWHMYNGDHSEGYWSAHVTEYLQWYAEVWKSSP
jgi:enterochelin esterase-like enzyme